MALLWANRTPSENHIRFMPFFSTVSNAIMPCELKHSVCSNISRCIFRKKFVYFISVHFFFVKQVKTSAHTPFHQFSVIFIDAFPRRANYINLCKLPVQFSANGRTGIKMTGKNITHVYEFVKKILFIEFCQHHNCFWHFCPLSLISPCVHYTHQSLINTKKAVWERQII